MSGLALMHGTRPSRVGAASRWSWLLPVAAAAILMALIAVNGFPLVYDDTIAYMRRAAGALVVLLGPAFESEWLDIGRLQSLETSFETSAAALPPGDSATPRPWTSGRSVYYGFTIYLLAQIGGLWASAAFQALVAGILLYLAWFKLFELRSVALFLGACVLLTFLSSLAYFVGLIMPDVFAGFTILSLAMLATGWHKLGRYQRGLTIAIAAFSIMAHDSHLLIAGGLFGLVLIRLVLGRRTGQVRSPSRGQVAAFAACLVAGVLGGLLFNVTATAVTGQGPMRLPHLTAHIAGTESGARFLRQRCRSEEWAVCDHVDQLPMDWLEFMFGDPDIYHGASLDKRRRLSEEQLEIAAAMFISDPFDVTGLMLEETGKQLVSISYADVDQADMLHRRFPPSTLEAVGGTLLVRNPNLFEGLSRLQEVVGFLCIPLLLALVFVTRAQMGRWVTYRQFIGLVSAGILINAVVCGVIAQVYDRFQVRVIWLLPFALLLGLALLIEERRSRLASGNLVATAA